MHRSLLDRWDTSVSTGQARACSDSVGLGETAYEVLAQRTLKETATGQETISGEPKFSFDKHLSLTAMVTLILAYRSRCLRDSGSG